MAEAKGAGETEVVSQHEDPEDAKAEAAARGELEDAPPQPPVEEGMAEAIASALKIEPEEKKEAKAPAKEEPKVEAKKNAPAPTAEEKAAAEKKTAEEAVAKKKADEDAATKKAADEEAARLKGKKADDFQLTPEEKKALNSKSQQRFHELHRYAKTTEEANVTLKEQNRVMGEARDAILDAFAQYKVEPDELTPLMEVHYAIKTGNYDAALKWIDANREKLLVEMGREAPGVDLLKDFPDLKQEVEDETMTRQRAIELANARRRAQNEDRQGEQARKQAEAKDAVAKERATKLDEIDRWCAGLAKSDIDYKAKEAKILPKLKGVMEDYPPHLWVPTLKAIYDSIEIVKQPAPLKDTTQPLRASGARGGEKEPGSMEEAIAQGLNIAS